MATRQPTTSPRVRRRETYPMITTIGSAERKFASWTPFCRDNAVVIVERLVDSNGDAQVIVYCEIGRSGIELFGSIMTCTWSVVDLAGAGLIADQRLTCP